MINMAGKNKSAGQKGSNNNGNNNNNNNSNSSNNSTNAVSSADTNATTTTASNGSTNTSKETSNKANSSTPKPSTTTAATSPSPLTVSSLLTVEEEGPPLSLRETLTLLYLWAASFSHLFMEFGFVCLSLTWTAARTESPVAAFWRQ